jgi:hypothetical protein
MYAAIIGSNGDNSERNSKNRAKGLKAAGKKIKANQSGQAVSKHQCHQALMFMSAKSDKCAAVSSILRLAMREMRQCAVEKSKL